MTSGITGKNLVRYGSIIFFFIVIVGYGIWISRDLLFGIRLVVSGISDGMSTTEPIVEFSGRAEHARGITVDGRIVSLTEDGTWKDTIALLPGDNYVTISAEDKFGRTTSDEYRVYYNAPPPPAKTEPVPAPSPTTPETTPATISPTVTPPVVQ